MPRITDLKSEVLPGFENPLTTFTLHPDSDSDGEGTSSGTTKQSQNAKHSWANVQFVNSAGDGYGPYATTFGDIANKIASKPSLKPSCEKCGKRPEQDGPGFAGCASCKVARYCSRDCQTSHWKAHKTLCKVRVGHVKAQSDEAPVFRKEGVFVPQAVLRKWYYDNVDIVDYLIVQTLELYKGPRHTLWKTHAVVLFVKGGKRGGDASVEDLKFSDAEAVSFKDLARPEGLGLGLPFLDLVGVGKKIMLIVIPNKQDGLMLIEGHDLPLDDEWDGMEKDEMWHVLRTDAVKDDEKARAGGFELYPPRKASTKLCRDVSPVRNEWRLGSAPFIVVLNLIPLHCGESTEEAEPRAKAQLQIEDAPEMSALVSFPLAKPKSD
ncbi:MYND-type domain-containing protein [Mycena chlorophos]|uniref:MYND-type domain-containing protein n=1 Tax=Mycena chlorophos TaxID=658473 RepID=A0A8H6WKQ4_MYCCL|nr:MYND-type domain-containing protein [Mycena chlorophos]